MDEKPRECGSLAGPIILCIIDCSCDKHSLAPMTLGNHGDTALYIELTRSLIVTVRFTESLLVYLYQSRGTFTLTQTGSVQTGAEVIGPVDWTCKHAVIRVVMPSIVSHHMRETEDFSHFGEVLYVISRCRKTDSTGYLKRSCK